MQHKRALDNWYADGGFFSKALFETEFALKNSMDGKDEIMEQHSS